MPGIFTISLDFELHWGVFDKKERQSRKQCYLNTTAVIPDLLSLFSKNDIHVTWATVGALFAKDEQELKSFMPALKPAYINQSLSSYKYIEENGLDGINAFAHFSPELVKQIPEFEGQELATHTFSHYYCLEPGQNIEQFTADLIAAKEAAQNFGQTLSSLVFPRNQFNSDYLKTCFENGIKVVRSNPDQWFWSGTTEESTSLFRKLVRTGDTYLRLGTKTSYPLQSLRTEEGKPLQLPASRFLRPFHPKYNFLNKLRLQRILQEMEYAAKNNECYHLWWHPENFGDYPAESMLDLKVIVKHFNMLQEKYKMISWNMREYGEYFNL